MIGLKGGHYDISYLLVMFNLKIIEASEKIDNSLLI